MEALREFAAALPADLDAAVLVVLHMQLGSVSLLPAILSRAGPLPAEHAVDGRRLEPGRIYVAPPDSHLLLEGKRIRLSAGPRENGHRPAIDVLFRSAARAFGPRAVGVLLSGADDDGAEGLITIKRFGGVTFAQDPEEAPFPVMPQSAIDAAHPDHVLPVREIAVLAARPASAGGGGRAGAPAPPAQEESVMDADDIVQKEKAEWEDGRRPMSPSVLTCPECGGVLWELNDGDLVRFHCHTGHKYSMDALLNGQAAELESALWTAIRVLEERASLARRQVSRARERGLNMVASTFEAQAADAHGAASLVRQLVNGWSPQIGRMKSGLFNDPEAAADAREDARAVNARSADSPGADARTADAEAGGFGADANPNAKG